MKILSISQIKQLDEYTIKNEPIASIDLMERAANVFYEWLSPMLSVFPCDGIKIFCGPGNNGGDGLVVARLIAENCPSKKIEKTNSSTLNSSDEHHDKRKMFYPVQYPDLSGFNRAHEIRLKQTTDKHLTKFGGIVTVYIIHFTDKFSDDFIINLERLQKIKNVTIIDLTENSDLPAIKPTDIIIDAIFGSGLDKPVRGFPAKVIEHINQSGAYVVAIDIPSGLFADKCSISEENTIIRAAATLTFELPKYAFMFAENYEFVGQWECSSIGLHPDFIKQAETKNYYIDKELVFSKYKMRKKFQHKGHFGHGLLISGSKGKMGACVLGAKASLKSGIGLLTAHIPKCGYEILQTAVPEAMISLDTSYDFFTSVPDLTPYNAIGIGPGIFTFDATIEAFNLLLNLYKKPMVIDADGLNILSEHKDFLDKIPHESILTPHPKEFERLTRKLANDFERNEMQRDFAKKYNVYLVLKGAHTSIACPDGTCYFNSTGNPGMATAGSGDVLTGILLGLLAQGYSPKDAAILGVYLHGLAADFAVTGNESYESLIASDIINNLGKAFNTLYTEISRDNSENRINFAYS